MQFSWLLRYPWIYFLQLWICLQVLVMTPQILLHSLYHCFLRMDLIALLIFDECHHAQVKSNHPYAQIMKVRSPSFFFFFNKSYILCSYILLLWWQCNCWNTYYLTIAQNFYKTSFKRLPHIFGMTASPVVGKGNATVHFMNPKQNLLIQTT